jgi:hypothetical protein
VPVSLNHIYCSPNKLWEFPRSGVPILCSDGPEMTKRVEEHGIGWVIPKDQPTPLGIVGIIASLGEDELARAKAACAVFIEKGQLECLREAADPALCESMSGARSISLNLLLSRWDCN